VRLDNPLISVVIPCYNQSKFLGDAIESVIKQTYDKWEIIVVDDGSEDDTQEVACQYRQVHCIRQKNQGLSAARNTGIDAARGVYLVFLDADDRLVPDALRLGYDVMCAHPDCGFVSGHHYHIDHKGALQTAYPQESMGDEDPYLALLMNNYIGMHATVMYRRSVFDSVGKFDTTLKACEDYDFYLRVAQTFPTMRHDQVVAEYRHHDSNMSRDSIHMAKSVISVLNAQRRHFKDRPERMKAYRIGIHNWVNYYGQQILRKLASDLDNRNWSGAWTQLLTVLRYSPIWIRGLLK